MLQINRLHTIPYKEHSKSEKKTENVCVNPKKEEDLLALKEAETSKELLPPEDIAEEN